MYLDIIAIIVALLIGVWQIRLTSKMKKFEERQDMRDEKRHDSECFAAATAFIQKYSTGGNEADINLVPLCLVAYKYNCTYPYTRAIYRDFCSLPEDVQNYILKRCHVDYETCLEDDFFSKEIALLESVIQVYCPGDTSIFYDNGKYLERALLNYGEKDVPDYQCALDSYEMDTQKSAFFKAYSPEPQDNMSFLSHISNLLAYENEETPINRLLHENVILNGAVIGNASSADEIVISYLCCIVAKYISIYAKSKSMCPDKDIGYSCDYAGHRRMEDLFLDALFHMYVYNHV